MVTFKEHILSTTRFVLVRHGETPLNREMRYIGLRDDELTETGSQQAQQLASALAIFPVAAIYSSPLKRAYLTALPIAEQQNLSVQHCDALKESFYEPGRTTQQLLHLRERV